MSDELTCWFANEAQVERIQLGGQDRVRVAGGCVFCGKPHEVMLTPDQFDDARKGDIAPIPEIRVREFLISGICPACQVPMFEENEDGSTECGIPLASTVVFHHNDMDGRCGGAIAAYWAGAEIPLCRVELVEVDHGRPVPFDKVLTGDTVVIVDFSLKPDQMDKLFERQPEKVIWIDHHQSASRYDYGRELPGLRCFGEDGPSACELAWQYFFPGEAMPRGVRLIGDLDAWRLEQQPGCFHFHEGMRLHDTAVSSSVWKKVLEDDEEFIRQTIELGEVGCRFRDAYSRDLMEQHGFETTFEGHRAYACNVLRLGARAFGDRLERYPLCIAYSHDGESFHLTLYTRQSDIDVAAICERHGGGGHRQAAGFCAGPVLPFARQCDIIRQKQT